MSLNKQEYIIQLHGELYLIIVDSLKIIRYTLQKCSKNWHKPIEIAQQEFDNMLDDPFSSIFKRAN